MVCYEVNLLSLKFTGQNVDILVEVLTEMGLRPMVSNDKQYVYTGSGRNSIDFDLVSGKVELASGRQDKVNKIKRAYSMKVVEQVASKYKWKVKKLSKNKVQFAKMG